ncbi:hypothetical protein [Streptosporangium sp. NPDC006007]|uniref:hypothetical protein n=1 Tax=Streptosporangium sp. NPDC006007 TaxID=3154575 RepID=UPI0033AE7837
MRDEEFDECIAWWGGRERENREENERAWRVPFADIMAGGYNLDLTNPDTGDDLAHRSPQELIADLVATEREILGLLEGLAAELEVSK